MKFEEPVMDVIELNDEDIITTSSGAGLTNGGTGSDSVLQSWSN